VSHPPSIPRDPFDEIRAIFAAGRVNVHAATMEGERAEIHMYQYQGHIYFYFSGKDRTAGFHGLRFSNMQLDDASSSMNAQAAMKSVFEEFGAGEAITKVSLGFSMGAIDRRTKLASEILQMSFYVSTRVASFLMSAYKVCVWFELCTFVPARLLIAPIVLC
jgi:hypothetical protein